MRAVPPIVYNHYDHHTVPGDINEKSLQCTESRCNRGAQHSQAQQKVLDERSLRFKYAIWRAEKPEMF